MPGPPFPAEQNCQWRSKAGLLSRRAGPGIWRLSVVPPTGPAAPEGRAPAASTMDRGPIPWGPKGPEDNVRDKKIGVIWFVFTFALLLLFEFLKATRGGEDSIYLKTVQNET